MTIDPGDTTRILRSASDGEAGALDVVFDRVRDQLRGLAARKLGDEAAGHTLEPTALVHEVWIKLVEPGRARAVDRAHFLRLAGRAMRQVLVDHARRRGRRKRSADGVRVTLHAELARAPERDFDVLELDEALESLATLDARRAQIVELLFFSGLTVKEAAAVLGLSPKTVEKDWYGARAWLRRAISNGERSE